jgi:predicted nucleic acid-binding protein
VPLQQKYWRGRQKTLQFDFWRGLHSSRVVDLTPPLSPLASWRLGQGETEVLEYARRNPGTTAVLDDKAARRAARVLQLPLAGTLGLLIAAVRNKLLPSLGDAIEVVRANGLYVDSAIVAAITKEDD